MAIYHYRVGFVSRSTGRSAVQSAAYITGNKLEETRRDITADYRNRSSDIAFAATFAPDHAPAYMKNLGVWNSLESYEDHYAMRVYRTEATQEKYKSTAQIAQTTVVALPKELTPEVWKELVTDFVKERFVNRGLVVTVAIHNDEGNPHAHFQISRRTVTDKGEWSTIKDRDITTKASLIESRRLWAEKTNFYLAREGFDERVDHRSYADLGIPFEPTKHENWYAHKLEKSGLDSRIVNENKEIKDRNKEYLGFNPEEILKELTSKQATFSSLDLARIVQKRIGDDPKLASYVYEASLAKAAVVGTSLDGQARYTSPEYVQLETQALEKCNILMANKANIKINSNLQDNILKEQYNYLSSEQQQAVKSLCDEQQLNVLIGRAGTGKTTTLKAIVDVHNQSGYKTLGLAISAVASDNLALETNCSAETVAFYLDKWDRREEAYNKFWSMHPSSEHARIERNLHALDKYNLSDKHLVIIDEAGMIGTKQWASILGYIEKAKAKLIVVGDDNQFKAIEAGDFFRKLKECALEQNNLSGLNSIIRQKEEWMRTASEDLAELKTYQALSAYEQHCHIKEIDTADLKNVATSYVEKRIAYPGQSGLLLASTRAQCQELNTEARRMLQEKDLISTNDININGRPFSIGDEIVFLKNDRDKSINCYDIETGGTQDFLIKNGTRGKIISIEEAAPSSINVNKFTSSLNTTHQITVAIDNQTKAQFKTNEYNHFDHSYAITLHKAQGQTVDWSMIVVSKNMDAHATYVALTRHRKDVTLFYDKNTFSNFNDLQKSLSRVSRKDLVLDYTIRPEHQGAWENIQEYVLLGQDLTAMSQKIDWSSYHGLKKERDTLGQNIVTEWKEHSSYAHQAGLSKESIEIACGLKMRPLSSMEQLAQLKVQEYAKKSIEARLLWREIRKTHPGSHCYEHSKYDEFSNIRKERNQFAEEITGNRPLYKQFVSTLGKDFGIGWKTLNSQTIQNGNFTKDRLNVVELINNTLNKYHLKSSPSVSNHDFMNRIQSMYEKMIQWNKTLDKSNTHAVSNLALFEQAIIAESIKANIKKEYCFLLTPSDSLIRSEGIAFIASSLIRENPEIKNKVLLEQGAHMFDDKNNGLKEFLIQEYQKIPSQKSLKINNLVLQNQNKFKSQELEL